MADPHYGFGRMAEAAGTLSTAQDYYDRISSILPQIRRIQDACRANGVEVMFTRIEANTADGRDMMPGYRLSGVIVPKGSKEAEILPDIGPVGDEIVLSKTSSSAFNSTALDQILRNLTIDRLMVLGISTHGCVELTARDADDRGFWVYVVSDACTAATEQLHADSLGRMSKGLTRICSTEEALALINSSRPRIQGEEPEVSG